MVSNRRVTVIAVLVGLLTVLLINIYMSGLEDQVRAEVSRKAVVVAEHTIPQNTRLTSEMLSLKELPEEAVHPAAARSLDDVLGGVTRAEIFKGEQVLQDRVFNGERGVRLAYQVPESMRAISISVDEVSGVSGFLSPGDRIDLLVTYTEKLSEGTADPPVTHTVLQNILVLAAGEEIHERESDAPQIVETVTLAVTPEQAEVVAFAQVKGTVHLALRSPLDGQVVESEGYGPFNFGDFKKR